jgi:hypothetical protein
MNVEEAQEATDVVLGMFPVNSVPARVPTTAERLTSDRPFWLTSDGQTACHWYAVTGNKLLVTGKLPVTGNVLLVADIDVARHC